MDKFIQGQPTYKSLTTILITHLSQTFTGLVFRDALPIRDSYVTAVEYPIVVRLVSDTVLDEACGIATRRAVFNISAYDRKDCDDVEFVDSYNKALVILTRQLEGAITPNKRILDVREQRSYVLPISTEYYAINAVVSFLYQENSGDLVQAHYPAFSPAPEQPKYVREEEFIGTCHTPETRVIKNCGLPNGRP